MSIRMKCTGYLLTLVVWYSLASNTFARHPCHHPETTCNKGGNCTETHDDPFYHCDCRKGFFGVNCEKHVCHIKPCIHGSCHRMTPSPYFSCNCSTGFTGDLCQDAITSPPVLTTVTTTSTGHRKCDKFGTMGDIVEQTQVSNNLTTCFTGTGISPEAFVIEHCNVTSSFNSWKKGLQVMEACNGRAYLPSYTPVGIFQTENYIDTMQGGTVGIFLGCLGDAGFKIGIQACDSIPLIEHIDGTFFTMNPNNYFAIV